jgi:hypothetical protein
MKRTVDKILATLVIVGLSFALLAETANLIGFGSQEHYLQHPDYPEGPDFKRDISNGFIQLTFWTIITAALLTVTIYSRIKKNINLFNQLALTTFIVATYLPILTILNGLTTRGFIMAGVTLGLAGLTLIKMKYEKKHWL